MLRTLSLCSAAALAAALAMPAPAQALTMKECSAKYQAAKQADTLKGMKWNDFRKAECSDDDASEAEAAAAEAEAPKTTAPKTTTAPKPAATSDQAADGKGLSMKECGAKYQAAKEAGTLKGLTWNEYRKAECAAGDSAAAEPEPAPKPSPSSQAAVDKTPSDKTAAPKRAPSGSVKFPSDVSSKYESESAGKARMHTCLDQYRANKDAGVEQPNWIEKGGGYYSQCNTRLKEGA